MNHNPRFATHEQDQEQMDKTTKGEKNNKKGGGLHSQRGNAANSVQDELQPVLGLHQAICCFAGSAPLQQLLEAADHCICVQRR